MKIKSIIYTGVEQNGTLKDGRGAVQTKGIISMSHNQQECGSPSSNSSEEYWLLVLNPITSDGTVDGIKITFDSKFEMYYFLMFREIIGVD